MCKSNFVLVVGFVGFPSQTPSVALVKYEMTGEAEKTDNPNGSYGDSIKCVIEIFAEQLIVAEEKANCACSNPQCCDDMCNQCSTLFEGTNTSSVLQQMLIAALHENDCLFSIAILTKDSLSMRVMVDIVNYLKSWTDSVTK